MHNASHEEGELILTIIVTHSAIPQNDWQARGDRRQLEAM